MKATRIAIRIACASAIFLIPQPLHADEIQRQKIKAAQTQALSNVRQIGLALFMFDTDFGTYPSGKTREEVEKAADTKLPADDPSSNALFRQLIAGGMVSTESIFHANIPGATQPDNDIQAGKILTRGENAFAYITGVSSAGNSATPVVLAPLIPGTTKFDPKPFGGMAVVLRIDNSARLHPIEEDGTVLIDGVDLLAPENPVWRGTAPDIRYPDLAPLVETDPEFEKAVDEIVAEAMKHAAMGAPTDSERAGLAEFKTKYGKLALSADTQEDKRNVESQVIIDLPSCFDGERQILFRRGLSDAINAVREDAKALQVEADLMAIRSSLEMYKLNAGQYPTTAQGLQALVTRPEVEPIPKRWVKIAPKVPVDLWGNAYQYRMPGTNNTTPDVFSMGPDGKPGTADDITSP